MEIIPAIDLRGGMCVRLYQGSFDKETVYADDPVRVALQWTQEGAHRLHIVDLDGALKGEPVNHEVIKSIVASVSISIQVGGGIRNLETAKRFIEMGVNRVVLGTVAVDNPFLVESLCLELGREAVVVAIDAREGQVAIKGWKENTSISATELAKRMTEIGVRRFLYTDISRDGTLTEPNFDAIERLVNSTGLAVLASGGISSSEHIKRLAKIGVEGVILGRAIYSGALDLADAIEAAK